MDEKLREQMLTPDFYPHVPASVTEYQTHISHVFIAPPYVYKVKKPVDFGFLNFTTLARRRFFTHRELYLNSRFSPGLYLDVLPITFDGRAYHLNGEGDAVEYALRMRRFNDENTMKKLIASGGLSEGQIDRLSKKLSAIHQGAHRVNPARGLGAFTSVKFDCEENFDQLSPFAGDFIEESLWRDVKEGTLGFLERHRALFELRSSHGFIRDCHGDLHTEHIIFEEKEIYIFDCIEFNERFRYIDTMSDFAFLMMELAFLGQQASADRLEKGYFDLITDKWGPFLLNFYACYRATVRSKVHAFTAGDDRVPESQREASRQLSVRYLELANRLVQAYQRPALVLTMGLSGTGKTMVAKKLEVLSGIRTLHSDVIRKDLFQGPDARTGQWNDGMYRPENKMQVYEKMFKEAENSLKAGDSICLDASFLDPLQREMAVRTAERQQAALTVLLCQCDEAEVREHLSKRKEAGEDPSDADFAIYLKQKAAFTGPAPIPASRVFSVDTSGDIPEGELELLAPFFKG